MQASATTAAPWSPRRRSVCSTRSRSSIWNSAPEPNITIFWDPKLPEGYKRFCAQISIDTSAIQYESDKEIRNHWGDDAAIACCVSPMRVGKQMQFFAARVNSAKALLYAINGGRDEMTGMQVIDKGIIEPIQPEADGTARLREGEGQL